MSRRRPLAFPAGPTLWAITRDAPRLPRHTRVRALLAAFVLALFVTSVVIAAWTWWVDRIRARQEIPPIPVIYADPLPLPDDDPTR